MSDCKTKEILAAIKNGNFIVGKNGVADTKKLFSKYINQESVDAIQKLAKKYPEQWEKLIKEEFI